MAYRDRLLTCPRCRKPLDQKARRERWLCRTCNGIAVEVIEVRRLLARVVPDHPGQLLDLRDRPPNETPLFCPACGQPMRPVELQGVALDRCEQDQLLWFDATELDRVIDGAIADHESRKGWARKLRDLLFAN